jgi:phosphate transport system protein
MYSCKRRLNCSKTADSQYGSINCKLSTLPPCPCPFDVDEMAGRIHGMLNRSLEALINLDADLAAKLIAGEEEINAMHQTNLRLVKEQIRNTPEDLDALMHHLSVSRYLERIGDLINNLGMEVIYIVEGKIIQPQQQSDEPVG